MRVWPWLLAIVTAGALATLCLTWMSPHKSEFLGSYWVLPGLPWSALGVLAVLAGVLPSGYPGLMFLMVSVFLNVAVVRMIEKGRKR